jgi:cell division septum initiation protein DivIVA
MAAKRRDEGEGADAKSKLSRLLETEVELEAMLKEARQEAKRLVELAESAAEDRVQKFELRLEAEEAIVRDRIARERDQAIASIREEARRETDQLDALDDATVNELASYVLDLLLGRPGSRGSD